MKAHILFVLALVLLTVCSCTSRSAKRTTFDESGPILTSAEREKCEHLKYLTVRQLVISIPPGAKLEVATAISVNNEVAMNIHHLNSHTFAYSHNNYPHWPGDSTILKNSSATIINNTGKKGDYLVQTFHKPIPPSYKACWFPSDWKYIAPVTDKKHVTLGFESTSYQTSPGADFNSCVMTIKSTHDMLFTERSVSN